MPLPDLSHVSESVKRLNPHLWPSAGLGGLQAHELEPKPGSALEQGPSPAQGRRRRVAGHGGPVARVILVAYVHRALDGDNLAGGCKPLRDAIASWLGVDDADGTIAWEYGQVETRGREGIAVRIEV